MMKCTYYTPHDISNTKKLLCTKQVTLQEGNFLIHQNLLNAIVIINSMTTYGSLKLDLSFPKNVVITVLVKLDDN